METYSALEYEYNIYKRKFKIFETIEIGDKIYQSSQDDLLYLDKRSFFQSIMRIWRGESRQYTITYLNLLLDNYTHFLKSINSFIERNSRGYLEELIEGVIELNIVISKGLEILVGTYDDYEDMTKLHEKIQNIFRMFKVSTTISNSKIVRTRPYY